MLGSPILYLKGMRILMFQLSGFYCRVWGLEYQKLIKLNWTGKLFSPLAQASSVLRIRQGMAQGCCGAWRGRSSADDNPKP